MGGGVTMNYNNFEEIVLTTTRERLDMRIIERTTDWCEVSLFNETLIFYLGRRSEREDDGMHYTYESNFHHPNSRRNIVEMYGLEIIMKCFDVAINSSDKKEAIERIKATINDKKLQKQLREIEDARSRLIHAIFHYSKEMEIYNEMEGKKKSVDNDYGTEYKKLKNKRKSLLKEKRLLDEIYIEGSKEYNDRLDDIESRLEQIFADMYEIQKADESWYFMVKAKNKKIKDIVKKMSVIDDVDDIILLDRN